MVKNKWKIANEKCSTSGKYEMCSLVITVVRNRDACFVICYTPATELWTLL